MNATTRIQLSHLPDGHGKEHPAEAAEGLCKDLLKKTFATFWWWVAVTLCEGLRK